MQEGRTTHSATSVRKERTFRSGPYLDKLFGAGERVDAYLQREICQRIKQARKAAGLTQEDMASLLNVTTRAYQNYERDRVPFRSLGKIAQLTNVQEVWLLHGEQRTEATDRGLLESAATTIDLLRVIADELVAVRQALLRIEQATTSRLPAQQTDAPAR